MTKRKVEVPQHARDCKTIAEKVAFSLMIAEKLDASNDVFWSGPCEWAAIMDKYHDPDCPWSDPAWASDWARAERAKREILRTLGDDK